MNITCRSMCYLSVCLSSFVAIYCPYSYLRPNDGHHFSVICQSVCYHLWPSVVHILTFVHMMDIACLSSVSLSVIICGHLLSISLPSSIWWTSLVCHLQSVIICGLLLSVSAPASPWWTSLVCHLSICLSSSVAICCPYPYLRLHNGHHLSVHVLSVSLLSSVAICCPYPYLRPHDGRLPFVRVVYFVDHLFQFRLQSRKQRWI